MYLLSWRELMLSIYPIRLFCKIYFNIVRRFLYLKNKLFYFLFNKKIKDTLRAYDFYKKDLKSFMSLARKNAHYLMPPESREKVSEFLKKLSPKAYKEVLDEADHTCHNSFYLFGYLYSFGSTIKWNRDYVSGYEWPLDYYGDIKIINLSDSSDVKYVWELNRCFSLLKLGQAYWLTGNEKYTKMFINLVYLWIIQNPCQRGVNWSCSMEIAIRAVNLIRAYCFFIDSPELSYNFHVQFYNLIYAHGRHIFRNLENKNVVKGNHYIANIAGILIISTMFPMMKYSTRWKKFSLKEIKREMNKQMLDDGVNFEGSICYHRFVTEMFFYAVFSLANNNLKSDPKNQKFSYREMGEILFGVSFINKLEKSFEFIYSYIRPDGLAPQIGDNDNGRFLPLRSSACDTNNHKHLLALSGEFFDRDDFRLMAGDCYCEALWTFGDHIKIPSKKQYAPPLNISRSFKTSGFYIMRHNNNYLIAHCGALGSRGKGTHSHNDNLSFELCCRGKTFIVDPGSYSYTGNPEMRNLLRSTLYHNTLVINGKEQNDMSENDMFMLSSRSEPKTIFWNSNKYKDIFIGQINYKKEHVIHRRKIIFNKKTLVWSITDFLSGKNDCTLLWNFHIAPKIKIYLKNKYILFVPVNGESTLKLENFFRNKYESTVIDGYYSSGYGCLEKSQILQISCKTEVPGTFNYCFSPGDKV
jgi:hypothetical protein